ncbi:MAG: hypothetical protein KDD47_13675, partial [Acidobacteria bacterium]|nr:hypothetical protein [Acidobacteriota bacterium]
MGAGVLRTIDGALLRSWEFVGPDLTGELPSTGEQLADLVARALGLLGDGWIVHVEGVRRKAPPYPAGGEFFSEYLWAFDRYRARRAERGERKHQTRYFLTLTYQAQASEWREPGQALKEEAEGLRRFLSRSGEFVELLKHRLS